MINLISLKSVVILASFFIVCVVLTMAIIKLSYYYSAKLDNKSLLFERLEDERFLIDDYLSPTKCDVDDLNKCQDSLNDVYWFRNGLAGLIELPLGRMPSSKV